MRAVLHRAGFRFRLHVRELPGRPDIVLPRYRTAIFVHGCFWHRHPGCANAAVPSSNRSFWVAKFARTVERDRQHRETLQADGWVVEVVWECELPDGPSVRRVLHRLRAARQRLAA